jgi:hypothetical protein
MATMDAKKTAPPAFPGFKKLSPKIYLYEPPTVSTNGSVANGSLSNGHATHRKPASPPPDTIILFGWADGSPRHVAKYTDAYQKLYPSARIIAIPSRTMSIFLSSAEATQAAMKPAITALLSSDKISDGRAPPGRVLLHILSNGGAMNLVGFSQAYQAQTNHFLPHVLLVSDSTPGGDKFSTELMNWARGASSGLISVPPFKFMPKWLVLGLTVVWCVLSIGIPTMFGVVNVATRCRRSINDEKFMGTGKDGGERIYLYSEGDEVIGVHGIESHAKESEGLGWRVKLEKFEKSAHVSHARTHPEQYWGAVTGAWDDAVGRSK